MPEFSTKQREKLAEENEAMPDGSYPIRNRADLKRAIQAFGRSKNPDKTKAWIKRRARELDAEDLIPESWLQHIDDSEYLIHYGVMGMKWGVRRAKAKADKYNKKVKRGSLHGVTAKAYYDMGLQRLGKRHHKIANKKIDKWRNKASEYSKKAKDLSSKSKQKTKNVVKKHGQEKASKAISQVEKNKKRKEQIYNAVKLASDVAVFTIKTGEIINQRNKRH